MKYLLLIYGFLFALPLNVLNILPGGMKFDDLVLFIILFCIFLKLIVREQEYQISIFYVIFVFFTIFAAFLAFIKSSLSTDVFLGDSGTTVIFRVFQSILILTFILFCKRDSVTLRAFFKGYVFSSVIGLCVFFYYFISKFDLATFAYRGVYFTKDIFQYNDDSPFSIHVNTIGSLFLISFFIIRFKFQKFIFLSYAFLLPSFLLISKGDILAIFLFFAISFYNRRKFNLVIVFTISILSAIIYPLINVFYLTLSEYRLSASGRDSLYSTAISLILDNPLGFGLGMQNNILFETTNLNFPAHNFFLSIGLEFGLAYLLFISLFMTLCLLKIDKVNRAIFLSFIAIGFFGNVMYFYKYHALAISLCLFGLLGSNLKNGRW